MRLAALCAVGIACGGSSPAVDAGGEPDAAIAVDAAPDAAPEVTLLAAGGVQMITTGDIGLHITPADLATDADVIELHQEFYGVPWEEFAADAAPPPAWVAVMDGIAGAARATGKPIFLSISMLNGGRNRLAARTAIRDGKVRADDGWSAECYDFRSASDGARYRQAYLRYARWMTERFAPRWLNLAIEVNLFFEHCPAAAPGVIDVANATYDAVKLADPARVVFPSIQVDHLYGYDAASCADPGQRAACFDRNYAQIQPLKRDRFAISTYPIPLAGQTVASLPADWFTRGAARGGERPLIAETGALATSLVVKPRDAACQTLFQYTEADAAAYLTRVLGDARAAHMELVNWWSDRDLVVPELMTSCPCTFDTLWCAILDEFRGPPSPTGPDTQLLGELGLKAFGTMGLRGYTGAPKSLLAIWQAGR